MSVPHWQLPPGCTRGLWEYAHSDVVAEDFDDYFAHHQLLQFDVEVVSSWLLRCGQPGQLVADLGCGTGRALLPLVERGFRGLGVDLSASMLDVLRRKACVAQLDIEVHQGNWVDLGELPDRSVDHCISLFSTLGMIQGRPHRRSALRQTRRILAPGGLFLLHVHNWWFNLRDPGGGAGRALRDWLRGCFSRRWERGDRYFPYRGVQNMFLHVFTRREIRRDLRGAGFRIRQMIPIDPHSQRQLPRAWLLPSVRATGWIIIAQ